MYYLIIGIAALLVGTTSGYFIRKTVAKAQAKGVEAKVEALNKEAKTKYQETLYRAKEKAMQIIDEAKRDEGNRRRELKQLQERLEKRENLFDKKLLDLEAKTTKLQDKAKDIEIAKDKIKKIQAEQIEKLEKIAGLNREEAKKVLLENVERDASETLASRIKKLDDESSTELEKHAKTVLTNVIQRCAASHAVEMTTSTVSLPSDEMKGRIIGREGRNIRTFEQLTGVEVVVDDTPEVITLSSFSPIRREVAKRTLGKLILDGRIHPAKIEDSLEESKKELALEIKKAGEDASYEVGIAGLDPKLIQIIGRLKFRTSFGQNVLQHSIEVAHLSALLAEQLGADVTIAKKAGFLHDIGKAVDHEIQGTHPEIGRDIARKFDLPDEIIQPILTHHEDKPPTLESIIVKAADAISGARPGARKDTYENYLQRLEELENIATKNEGVEKAYAIQAGREVRVFVHPEEVDDLQSYKIAENIAKKIEEDLKYPGEIKVTVIRENRAIEYAR